MAVAVEDSGAQTATINTEHTLSTVTSPLVLVYVVDLAALTYGDVVELRVYGKARSSDSERLLHRATYGPCPVAAPLVMSVPIVSPHHTKVTLKQTAGTGRAFPWALYST